MYIIFELSHYATSSLIQQQSSGIYNVYLF